MNDGKGLFAGIAVVLNSLAKAKLYGSIRDTGSLVLGWLITLSSPMMKPPGDTMLLVLGYCMMVIFGSVLVLRSVRSFWQNKER